MAVTGDTRPPRWMTGVEISIRTALRLGLPPPVTSRIRPAVNRGSYRKTLRPANGFGFMLTFNRR
jgi:hypothetical protein